MLSFFDKIPDMECLQGDTLPSFEVKIDDDLYAQLTGNDPPESAMYLLVSKKSDPARALVQKKATLDTVGEQFVVELNGTDTATLLEGSYVLNFVLDIEGAHFKKLTGNLYVKAAPAPVPEEESEE